MRGRESLENGAASATMKAHRRSVQPASSLTEGMLSDSERGRFHSRCKVSKETDKEKKEKTTEEEEDEILLICMPALPGERPSVPGGGVRECKDCQRPVWVAPTGLKMEREKGAQIVCMACASKRMKDDPDAKISKPTPEQMEEIERTLRWNQARRFKGDTGSIV
jgi:hypothetical protein